MSYTLVVVDVQEEFTATHNQSVITACQDLIHQSIQDHAVIIMLEFIGCGRTMEPLYNIVDNYYNLFTLRKPSCDGSYYIKRLNEAFELQDLHFKICGVNTDACVQDTVLGLSRHYPEAVIEVVEPACNSDVNHHRGLEIMKKCSNVIVTGEQDSSYVSLLKTNVN